MRTIKWPDGDCACPKCGAKGDRIGEIATRGMLRCKDFRKQFSVKVDTIFEDSPPSRQRAESSAALLTIQRARQRNTTRRPNEIRANPTHTAHRPTRRN